MKYRILVILLLVSLSLSAQDIEFIEPRDNVKLSLDGCTVIENTKLGKYIAKLPSISIYEPYRDLSQFILILKCNEENKNCILVEDQNFHIPAIGIVFNEEKEAFKFYNKLFNRKPDCEK